MMLTLTATILAGGILATLIVWGGARPRGERQDE